MIAPRNDLKGCDGDDGGIGIRLATPVMATALLVSIGDFQKVSY